MRIKDKIKLGREGLEAEGPITIVAFGDSVTHGALRDSYSFETAYWNLLYQKIIALRCYIPVTMINAGIDDGDLVLIKRCERVREGRIAAFLYDNSQTTLKRFKQDKNAIYLIPENDAMEPIVISGRDRERLIIQGEAIMVMKDL